MSVEVGSLKLSTQSAVVFVSVALIAVLLLLRYPSTEALIAASILIGTAVIQAYGINCLSSGHCEIYAWVLAVLLAIEMGVVLMAILADKNGSIGQALKGQMQ